MMNCCSRCGAYRADKIIDPSGPYAICPECSHRHPFRQLPLLAIGGPSAAGKTTIGELLIGKLHGVILLEGDLLWSAAFDNPKDNYRDFYETWLRLAKNISQSGTPVAILNAGIVAPGNVEPCVERRYFSTIHYCAIVCDDEVLAERLRERPSWRKSADQAFIEGNIGFNRWLKANAERSSPRIHLIDTTQTTPQAAASQVESWITERMGPP